MVGVHTPEFPFERDVDNVREAAKEMRVEYPVALDSDYAVWQAFSNHYWPAVYIADAEGRIRHHQFGEGGYEECERIVQQLLREAGGDGISDDLVSGPTEGFELQADWANLETPESYLGYEQAQNFASPGGAERDELRAYDTPEQLRLNQWALAGDWTVGGKACVLDGAGGRIVFRFHARDVHLVMSPGGRGRSVPFRVLVDGEPPGDAHGFDVDERGSRHAVRGAAPSADSRARADRGPHVRDQLRSLPAPRPTASRSARASATAARPTKHGMLRSR